MGNIHSKKLVLQIGITAATTAALLYIYFGPKPPPGSSFIWEPPIISTSKEILGLYNLGNSCYLSSILQALAACRNYVIYVNKYNELKSLASHLDKDDPAFRITTALSTSNKYINRDVIGDDVKMSCEIPKSIITTFKTLSPVSLGTYEEQDAHELFNVITNAMIEEQKALQRRPDYLEAVRCIEYSTLSLSTNDEDEEIEEIVSSGDGRGLLNVLGKTTTGTHIVSKGSLIELEPCPSSSAGLIEWNNPFVGRFASVFKCLKCSMIMPIKFEEFSDISLSLPPKRTVLILKDLIEYYFFPTVVEDVDCLSCSEAAGTNVKSQFQKKTCISKFPRSLCLHINRAEWGPNSRSNKRFDFIPFAEILDLRACGFSEMLNQEPSVAAKGDNNGFISRRQNTQYKLMSVICHRGSANSGHFVTYRRSPGKGESIEEWYMVSDAYICAVMSEQVLLQHAYMLFYDRLE